MAENRKNNKRNRNNEDNYRSNKNKKRNYGSKSEAIVKLPDICTEPVEYIMSKEMAEMILKETGAGRAPQIALCEYVNRYYGLKGYCVKVVIG